MFSVRIPRSLRQAVKLAAVEQGTTIEAWIEQALRATFNQGVSLNVSLFACLLVCMNSS